MAETRQASDLSGRLEWADALPEALDQDNDGLIRVAPAVPPVGFVTPFLGARGRTKVDVQVREGVPTTIAIESGIVAAAEGSESMATRHLMLSMARVVREYLRTRPDQLFRLEGPRAQAILPRTWRSRHSLEFVQVSGDWQSSCSVTHGRRVN